MELRKLYYQWRQTRIVGESGYVPSLKMQIGAAVIVTLFLQAQLVNAKNDNNQEKQNQKQAQQANHQAQKQAQQANHQAQKQAQQANQQASHQAQKQAQQYNHQAQKQAQQQQAQNQHAQNQAAQNQARNQQAQYKAAQDQFKNQAAQNADRNRERDRQANNQAKDRERERQANNQANDRERNAANNRANERARNEANNRANQREINQANARNNDRNKYRHNQQANNRPGQYKRWDNGMNNRQRYQAYKKYRNNWSEQRVYLRSNLNRFNELARLNQQQQNLIDSQMRAAYLAYHNNQYNGPYNWSNYSNPQFIDYMHTNNPSLLQRILSMLGLGVEDEYLYSSNWTDERSELTQNMANIHQLAMEGRITRAQEQQLLDQLRPEFMDYHHNNYNGSIGWSQYSDPGFVDYLNQKRPSILMTVRDYLIR